MVAECVGPYCNVNDFMMQPIFIKHNLNNFNVMYQYLPQFMMLLASIVLRFEVRIDRTSICLWMEMNL